MSPLIERLDPSAGWASTNHKHRAHSGNAESMHSVRLDTLDYKV